MRAAMLAMTMLADHPEEAALAWDRTDPPR
jgi:hypothetical protein